MLKQLLVGLNGSEYSQAAMDASIALAAESSAALIGLGIVDVPRLTAPQSVPLGAGDFKEDRDEAVVQAEHAKIDRALAAFVEGCRAAGVDGRTLKLEGDPVQLLVREAQRADLLVVGKKHIPTEEWDRASRTLEGVLRGAPRPVLCVPRVTASSTPVLIAYDGSAQAARTLQLFAASGLARERALHVLALGDDARQQAELAADFLRSRAFTPQLHIEGFSDSVATRILEVAQETDAGLIVLGCYGDSRLRQLFFGSVTKTVLSETNVPLFLFH